MADDIVHQLSDLASRLERGNGRSTVSGAVSEIAFLRGEIERLHMERDRWQATAAGISQDISNAENEIERLQTLGDDLVDALRTAQRRHPCDCADSYDARTGVAAIAAWEKTRRG